MFRPYIQLNKRNFKSIFFRVDLSHEWSKSFFFRTFSFWGYDWQEAFHVLHSWRCWQLDVNDELHYILANLAMLRPHAESHSKFCVATNAQVSYKRRTSSFSAALAAAMPCSSALPLCVSINALQPLNIYKHNSNYLYPTLAKKMYL